MTVEILVSLFIEDQEVEIFDNNSCEVIFKGLSSELPEELKELDVDSIDNIYADNKGVFTINVPVDEGQ